MSREQTLVRLVRVQSPFSDAHRDSLNTSACHNTLRFSLKETNQNFSGGQSERHPSNPASKMPTTIDKSKPERHTRHIRGQTPHGLSIMGMLENAMSAQTHLESWYAF